MGNVNKLQCDVSSATAEQEVRSEELPGGNYCLDGNLRAKCGLCAGPRPEKVAFDHISSSTDFERGFLGHLPVVKSWYESIHVCKA